MAVTERVIGWTRRPLRPVPLLAKHPALRSGIPLFAWDAADGLLDQFGRLLAPVGSATTREAGEGPETVAGGSGNRIDAPFNFSPPAAACTVVMVFRPEASTQLFQSHTSSNYSGIRCSTNASTQLVFEYGDGAGTGASNRRSHVVTAALTPGQQVRVVISFTTLTAGYFIVDGAPQAHTSSGTATGYSAGTTNGVLHAQYQSGAYSYTTNTSALSSLVVLPYFIEQDLGESLGRNPWQLYARTEEHAYNYSGVPEISGITADDTSAEISWSGLADEYRINNGTATALPDGISPDTITGLTVNTEYNTPGLQLRYLGGAWSAAVPFGTTNPGGGGGEAAVPIVLQVAEETDTAFALFLAQVLGVAVETDEAVQLLQPGALEAAQETDEAVALVLINPGVITAAEEADEAVALVLISLGTITAAEETDEAVSLVLISPIALGVAVESDEAVSLASTGGLPEGLVRALSRTFVVYPDVMVAGSLPASTVLRPRFLKDPQARLDYSWDLRPYLAEASDALAAFEVLPQGTVAIEGPYLVDSVVTVVASGVADGELAALTLRFDTAAGRQDDRTIELQGVQR